MKNFHVSFSASHSILQVSRVYQTMKIESLAQMIPFFNFLVVEKISVEAVKHKFITLRIDHAKGIVQFGDQVSV